jgi:hypothetical protein
VSRPAGELLGDPDLLKAYLGGASAAAGTQL